MIINQEKPLIIQENNDPRKIKFSNTKILNYCIKTKNSVNEL